MTTIDRNGAWHDDVGQYANKTNPDAGYDLTVPSAEYDEGESGFDDLHECPICDGLGCRAVETGEPADCRLNEAVGYHGNDEDGGREAALWAMEDAARAQAETELPEPGTVHTFPAWQLDDAKARIEAANKRLARAGIIERFEFEVSDPTVRTLTRATGEKADVPYVTLTMNAPQIAYGGHTFLAAVDREDGGLITRVQPDADLSGWRPEDMTCDHCGRAIERNHTYLIQAPDGSRIQVGSTCLQPYLGVKPTGLWALGFDPLGEMGSEKDTDDFFGEAGFNSGRSVVPTRDLLGLALAVSDKGAHFRPASWEGRTTGEDIRSVLWPSAKDRQERAKWLAETWALAEQYEKDGTVDAVLASVAKMSPDSDYAANLQTYVAGENVSQRGFNLVASAVKVYARDAQIEAEKAARPEPVAGFMAPVKASVKGEQVTVTKVNHRTEYDNYARAEVTRTQVVMADKDGHEVVWWASTKQEVEPGQSIVLTAGSVKKHDNYRGVDQTVLTRVKFETPDDQAATAAMPKWRAKMTERMGRDSAPVRAMEGVTSPREIAAAGRAMAAWGIGKAHIEAAKKQALADLGRHTPTPEQREAYLAGATSRDEYMHGARHGWLWSFDEAVAGATRDHAKGTLPDDAYRQIMEMAASRKAEVDENTRAQRERAARDAARQAEYDAAHPEDAAKYGRDAAGLARKAQQEAEWAAKWPEQAAAKAAKERQQAIDAAEAEAAFKAFGG